MSAVVVEAVGSCQIELTGYGFHVTRDGEPVPAKVYPPAVLTFHSKTHAREYAHAVDVNDTEQIHELIARHGRWWQ